MAYTIKQLAAPAFLAASSTNVIPTPISGSFYVLRLIHLCNDTGSAATATLYFSVTTDGSTAGTELCKGLTIGANSTYDLPLYLPMPNGYYLSGLASAGSTITITVSGEWGATT
jgi:hypothetical protein